MLILLLKKKRQLGITLCALGFLIACGQNDKQGDFYIDQYFDLKSLVDRQLAHYQDSINDAEIAKTLRFESDSETQVQGIKNIAEIRNILETAIINKPGLRGAYKVQWNYGTNKTGDTTYSVLSNTLKPDEDALVKELKAFYKGAPKRRTLFRVHIYKHTNNLLYQNDQFIQMHFKKGWLESLHMEGSQQILQFEEEKYGLTLKVRS